MRTLTQTHAGVDSSRRASHWFIAVCGIGLLGMLLSIVVAPAVVSQRPELVLLLGTQTRNLLLARPYMDAAALFFALALLRATLDVSFYEVGRRDGTAAANRLSGFLPSLPKLVARMQRFDRVPVPLLVLLEGATTLFLAGVAGTRRRTAYLAAGAGATLKVSAVWVIGVAFDSPLRWTTDWVSSHSTWLIVLALAMVALRSRLTQSSPDRADPGDKAGQAAVVGHDPVSSASPHR